MLKRDLEKMLGEIMRDYYNSKNTAEDEKTSFDDFMQWVMRCCQ
jgi:hypothetical protein